MMLGKMLKDCTTSYQVELYGRIKLVKLPEGKDLGDLRGVIPDGSFVQLEK